MHPTTGMNAHHNAKTTSWRRKQPYSPWIISFCLLYNAMIMMIPSIEISAFSIPSAFPPRSYPSYPKMYHQRSSPILFSNTNDNNLYNENQSQKGEKSEKSEKSEKNDTEYVEKLQDETFLRRNKEWVILVDDEEAIRLAVGDYLYDVGYQVTACADVDALLEVLQMKQHDNNDNHNNKKKEEEEEEDYYYFKIPNIIISDIRMPGKDGLELVKLIRSEERLSKVPIVLLTAKSLTSDRIMGYQAGADVYLPKPFDPEELLSIVDNAILRRSQMMGEKGQFGELKEEVSDIKEILKKNAKSVVQETDVYLTPTEREVLELLCQGYSNVEIAQKRNVGKVNVNRYVQNLYNKTNTRTRTELVRWAIATGQIARN